MRKGSGKGGAGIGRSSHGAGISVGRVKLVCILTVAMANFIVSAEINGWAPVPVSGRMIPARDGLRGA